MDTDDVTYVDNSYEDVTVDHEGMRIIGLINEAETTEQLNGLLESTDLNEHQMELFNEKSETLKKKKK